MVIGFISLVIYVASARKSYQHFCADGLQPILQCPVGYTLISAKSTAQMNRSRLLTDRYFCVNYVKTRLEWKCLRGKLNQNNQCETIHQRSAVITCPNGYTRFGFVCYLDHPPIQPIPQQHKTKDVTVNPITSPAIPPILAKMTCEEGELVELIGVCFVPRIWKKVPICVGEIGYEEDQEALICISSTHIKPNVVCPMEKPLLPFEFSISSLNVLQDL